MSSDVVVDFSGNISTSNFSSLFLAQERRKFIRNLNVNYVPNLLNARFDGRRQFGAIRPRNVGGGAYKIPETYDKYFVFDRLYNMR